VSDPDCCPDHGDGGTFRWACPECKAEAARADEIATLREALSRERARADQYEARLSAVSDVTGTQHSSRGEAVEVAAAIARERASREAARRDVLFVLDGTEQKTCGSGCTDPRCQAIRRLYAWAAAVSPGGDLGEGSGGA
jgi:hypothetical protein